MKEGHGFIAYRSWIQSVMVINFKCVAVGIKSYESAFQTGNINGSFAILIQVCKAICSKGVRMTFNCECMGLAGKGIKGVKSIAEPICSPETTLVIFYYRKKNMAKQGAGIIMKIMTSCLFCYRII